MKSKLAILGGHRAVSEPKPHVIWPPNADMEELNELSSQRNIDIGIRGRTGPIKSFEEKFLDFLERKVEYAVTFNSGTSALFAAYFALGVEEGVEVIGPALTYHAALSPVFSLKGKVVLVDIDKKTRCIDYNKIEEAITSKTKILTVVHQWGHPCNMDNIMRIVDKHSLKLVEDCSHAHGSRYKGKLCGTFGDVAVFSLQTKKAIFAGEGGILVTNNEEIYNRATLLGHYRDRSKEEIKDKDYQKYWATGFGLKLRMSPFNAIVAEHSLKHFNKIKNERHACLKYFIKKLKEVSYIEEPYVASDVDMGAWYGFKPLYNPEKLGGLSRNVLIQALQAEGLKIKPPSGPCLAKLPLYNEEQGLMYPNLIKYSNDPKKYDVANEVERLGLSLPTFSNWSKDKKIIDQYVHGFIKIEENYRDLLETNIYDAV